MKTSSIWIGKEIEVTHVNPTKKSVGIVIHLYCAPSEAVAPEITPETQTKVAQLVKFGVRYLTREGFLPDDPTGWLTHIGGVIHQKT